MEFTLSPRTQQAIDAIAGEWMGKPPIEMTTRLVNLATEDACAYLATRAILRDLKAIADRPSIKGRKP